MPQRLSQPDSEQQSASLGARLRDYADILWRRKLLVILCMMAAIAGSAIYDAEKTPDYASVAKLRLIPDISSAVLQANNSSLLSAANPVDVPTAVQVLQSKLVEDSVSRVVRDTPPVQVSQIGTTDIVDLTVESPDNRLASRAANAYAAAYIAVQREQETGALTRAANAVRAQLEALGRQTGRIQTQLLHAAPASQPGLAAALAAVNGPTATLRQQLSTYQTASALATGGAEIVATAAPAASPSSPKPVEYGVLAAIIGILVGGGAALLREQVDETIRTLEDAEAASLPLPILATVPEFSRRRGGGALLTVNEPASPAAEAYRTLRTAVRLLVNQDQSQIIQVTSADSGEGKSTTAANLAVALAIAGTRTVLVDCDFRRPAQDALFDLPERAGLVSVLRGEADLEDEVQTVLDVPLLEVVTAGVPPPNPSELLFGTGFPSVLAQLRGRADIVVVDTPPLLPVTDASLVARHADSLVTVLRAGSSRRRRLSRAIARLDQIGAPVLGVVFNGAPTPKTGRYASYYEFAARG